MTTLTRTLLTAAVCACCGALPQARAAGLVEVQWSGSASYRDAGRSAADRERVMQTLGAHFRQLGRLLPSGQTLKLEVTDLDLAGEIEAVAWHQLRVLRGRADWPQLSLRYTLSAGGSTLKSGEARLSDMNYLSSARQDDLGYEKRMVEQWFRAEFAPH